MVVQSSMMLRTTSPGCSPKNGEGNIDARRFPVYTVPFLQSLLRMLLCWGLYLAPEAWNLKLLRHSFPLISPESRPVLRSLKAGLCKGWCFLLCGLYPRLNKHAAGRCNQPIPTRERIWLCNVLVRLAYAGPRITS